MKSPYKKGQKLNWTGKTYKSPLPKECQGKKTWFSFPGQVVTVVSTDGNRGMCLIGCKIHIDNAKPRYRDKWVFDTELSPLK